MWPDGAPAVTGTSLSSLAYSLHKLIGDALQGAMPVVNESGYYRLNLEAGIQVDASRFAALVAAGERYSRAGDFVATEASYADAVRLYRGDLCTSTDLQLAIERERLRGLQLNVLAWLADYSFDNRDYAASLNHALRLLVIDPCRENGHRQAMRCYMRRGERAQALRQYRLCEQILRTEFDAVPEAATTALFDRLRLQPESV